MILMCCLIRKEDRDRQMTSNLWYCRPWRLNDVNTPICFRCLCTGELFSYLIRVTKLGVWKRLATVIGEVVLLQLQLPEMKSTALLCLLATVGHVSRYPLRNRRFFVRFVQPTKWMGDISTQTGRWETLVSFSGFPQLQVTDFSKTGFQQQQMPDSTTRNNIKHQVLTFRLCGLRGYGIRYIFFWSHLS